MSPRTWGEGREWVLLQRCSRARNDGWTNERKTHLKKCRNVLCKVFDHFRILSHRGPMMKKSLSTTKIVCNTKIHNKLYKIQNIKTFRIPSHRGPMMKKSLRTTKKLVEESVVVTCVFDNHLFGLTTQLCDDWNYV